MSTRAQRQAGFFQRHDNVLVYVPNLIGGLDSKLCFCSCAPHTVFKFATPATCHIDAAGYVRVASAFYAFAVASTNPLAFILAYFFSFVCDELDGRFARMLGQTSTLGAVLDMVTDRCEGGAEWHAVLLVRDSPLPLPLPR